MAERAAAAGVRASGVLWKQSMETAASNTHHGASSVHSGSLCVEAYICSRRENTPDTEIILFLSSSCSCFLFPPFFTSLVFFFFIMSQLLFCPGTESEPKNEYMVLFSSFLI